MIMGLQGYVLFQGSLEDLENLS